MDLGLEVPLASPLVLSVGGGMSASAVHKYTLAEGHFENGVPLLTMEHPDPPQNDLSFLDVIGELWTQVIEGEDWDLLFEVIMAELWDAIIFWDVPGRSVFELGPNGSTIDINETAIPEGAGEIACRYWEWGEEGRLHKNRSPEAEQKLKDYNRFLRMVREEIVGMRYGIGGFYAFRPDSLELLETATLSIVYSDEEITDLDESTLGIFFETPEGLWEPIASTVDTLTNTVTATIDQFHVHTVAPRMPQGQYSFSVDVDSLWADGVSTAILTSEPVANNDGSPIEDGTLFTVSATLGMITSVDVDTLAEGVQVETMGGLLTVDYQAGEVSGEATIGAESVNGYAHVQGLVTLYDVGRPDPPSIDTLAQWQDGFTVTWTPSEDLDLAGFLVWYDTDEPGPPYDGSASVWGDDSPVSVGMIDSLVVSGLLESTTFYVAITALDIEGKMSTYSEEFTVIVGVDEQPGVPECVVVEQNYPNPFNPRTIIEYAVPEATHVRMAIYDIRGRLIRKLVDRRMEAGYHQVDWDGTNGQGISVSSGMYFYRAEIGEEIKTRKLLLIR